MSETSTEVWPWLALAGLGLFHGLNPAMGWLFAVALGLHRGNRRIVLLSLVPITVGHAAAVAAALIAVLALGLVIDHTALLRLAALVVIGWAAWHAPYGHQRRVRVGMPTGPLGLVLWSFPSPSPRWGFIPPPCSRPSPRFRSSSMSGWAWISCGAAGSMST